MSQKSDVDTPPENLEFDTIRHRFPNLTQTQYQEIPLTTLKNLYSSDEFESLKPLKQKLLWARASGIIKAYLSFLSLKTPILLRPYPVWSVLRRIRPKEKSMLSQQVQKVKEKTKEWGYRSAQMKFESISRNETKEEFLNKLQEFLSNQVNFPRLNDVWNPVYEVNNFIQKEIELTQILSKDEFFFEHNSELITWYEGQFQRPEQELGVKLREEHTGEFHSHVLDLIVQLQAFLKLDEIYQNFVRSPHSEDPCSVLPNQTTDDDWSDCSLYQNKVSRFFNDPWFETSNSPSKICSKFRACEFQFSVEESNETPAETNSVQDHAKALEILDELEYTKKSSREVIELSERFFKLVGPILKRGVAKNAPLFSRGFREAYQEILGFQQRMTSSSEAVSETTGVTASLLSQSFLDFESSWNQEGLTLKKKLETILENINFRYKTDLIWQIDDFLTRNPKLYEDRGLTNIEYAVLRIYTSQLFPFQVFGRELRADDENPKEKWYKFLSLLVRGLTKMETPPSDTKLYRGIRGNPYQNKNMGESLVWSTPTSVSLLERVARRFLSGSNSTLFIITPSRLNSKAHKVADISKYPLEQEYIYLPDTIFMIDYIQKNSTGTIIGLQETS